MTTPTIIPFDKTGGKVSVKLIFGDDVRTYAYSITLKPDETFSETLEKVDFGEKAKTTEIDKDREALDKDSLILQVRVGGDAGKKNYWYEIKFYQDGKLIGTPDVIKEGLGDVDYKTLTYLFTGLD